MWCCPFTNRPTKRSYDIAPTLSSGSFARVSLCGVVGAFIGVRLHIVVLLVVSLRAVGVTPAFTVVLMAAAIERLGTLVPLTPGGTGLAEVGTIAWLVAAGLDPVGVVSGGFHEVVDDLVADAGIDHALANRLEVVDGVLTGRIVGPIVTRDLKRQSLVTWAQADGVPMSQTVALGDGANDIPMILTAGLGVAFCAKPAVRAAAPHAIDERDLTRVLELLR